MNRLIFLKILLILFLMPHNLMAFNQNIFDDAKIYFEKKDYD